MWVIDFYGFACDVSAFAVFILSISIILCGGILDFNAGMFLNSYHFIVLIRDE